MIKEDQDGTAKIYPYETVRRDGLSLLGDGTVLNELGRWSRSRRHKRESDSQKVRAQIESKARDYIDQLIRKEALQNIS